MAIYLIDKPSVPIKTPFETNDYPDELVYPLMFTSEDGSELTGKMLITENQGEIVCAPGSVATNNQRTLMKSFNGTDSEAGWETILDKRQVE